jgi:hypothetical protein
MRNTMNFTDEALRSLSWKLCGEDTVIQSRAQMEGMLLTMIRVAMRTGLGRPQIVQWVKDTLPAMTPVARDGEKTDLEWAAPRLARLLCSEMLQQVRAEPARRKAWETLAGL